jgi:hypothetical protein
VAPQATAHRAGAGHGGPGPQPGAKPGARVDGFVDEVLDELFPASLDWRHLVTSYPRTSVAVAALAGFLVARKRGGLVLAALTSYVAAQFGDAVVDLGEPRRD